MELAAKWMAEHVRPKLKPRTVSDYEQLLAQRICRRTGICRLLPLAATTSIACMSPCGQSRGGRTTPSPPSARCSISPLILGCGHRPPIRPIASNSIASAKSNASCLRPRSRPQPKALPRPNVPAKIGPVIAAGLRLALFTGARSGEIAAAQWQHVDYERRLIRLSDSKTNEPRTIHLSDAAVEVLRAIPHLGPYIIVGAVPGEPCKNLSRAWIIARTYAGLADVRLHDLRHSYASLAAGRGVSLQMIGKLLGHRSPQTTLDWPRSRLLEMGAPPLVFPRRHRRF